MVSYQGLTGAGNVLTGASQLIKPVRDICAVLLL
jgi:hypothetical protein